MNTRYFTSRLLALMLAALLVFSCAAAEETEIPSGVVDNFVQSAIEKQQSASDATAFEAGAAAGSIMLISPSAACRHSAALRRR